MQPSQRAVTRLNDFNHEAQVPIGVQCPLPSGGDIHGWVCGCGLSADLRGMDETEDDRQCDGDDCSHAQKQFSAEVEFQFGLHHYDLSGSGHPDLLHRDRELLVGPLSPYGLHLWRGAERMYLRMGSVLQGHEELEGLVPVPNRDAQRIALQLCLTDW